MVCVKVCITCVVNHAARSLWSCRLGIMPSFSALPVRGKELPDARRRERFREHRQPRVRQERLEVGGQRIPGAKHDPRTELGLAAL